MASNVSSYSLVYVSNRHLVSEIFLDVNPKSFLPFFTLFILIENKQKIKSFVNILFRGQYDMWKAECQKLVPVIGSGKFITTPLINDDDGQPTDPSLVRAPTSDKILQWMKLLHQIGMYMLFRKYWILLHYVWFWFFRQILLFGLH